MYEKLNAASGCAGGAGSGHRRGGVGSLARALSGPQGRAGRGHRALSTLPREERPAYGQAANEVKAVVEAAFGERQEALKALALETELTAGAVDVTLPGRAPSLGHLHITTQTLRQLYAIFGRDGLPGLRRARCGDR